LSAEPTLEKIKEAEAKAAEMVQQANEEKNRLVAEARNRASEIFERYENEMKEEREARIKIVRAELGEKQQKGLKIDTTKAEKIKREAEKKVQNEVDFLYQKFMEMILSD